ETPGTAGNDFRAPLRLPKMIQRRQWRGGPRGSAEETSDGLGRWAGLRTAPRGLLGVDEPEGAGVAHSAWREPAAGDADGAPLVRPGLVSIPAVRAPRNPGRGERLGLLVRTVQNRGAPAGQTRSRVPGAGAVPGRGPPGCSPRRAELHPAVWMDLSERVR